MNEAIALLESLYAEEMASNNWDVGYIAGIKTALNTLRQANESAPVVSADGRDPFGMPVVIGEVS